VGVEKVFDCTVLLRCGVRTGGFLSGF